MSLSKPADGRKKITRRGIIGPNLLERHTYNPVEGARTESEIYELTHDDFEDMAGRLTGRPLLSQHSSEPIGRITKNWKENNQWKVEFELDGNMSLTAEHRVREVEAGLMNSLSLSHRPSCNEPIEVSLVWDPAREGSVLTAAKKTAKYKESAAGSSSATATPQEDKEEQEDLPVFRIPRHALIQATKPKPPQDMNPNSGVPFILNPGATDPRINPAIVFDSVSAGQQQRLDQAKQMIDRDAKAAQDAEAKRKAIERDQAGRFAKPAQQQAEGGPNGTNPMANGTYDPTFTGIPSASDQLTQQMNGHMQRQQQQLQQQGGGGKAPMDLGESLAMPTAGTQIQQQVDQYTRPQVNAAAGQQAQGQQGQQGQQLAQGQGQPQGQGQDQGNGPSVIRTGDPEYDAFLNDPSLDIKVREQMLNVVFRKKQEQDKLRSQLEQTSRQAQEFQSKAAISEKALGDYRHDYMEADIAYKRMMLRNYSDAKAKERESEIMSGRLDSYITSDEGKTQLAANKQAIVELKAARRQQEGFSQEAKNRAEIMFRNSQQNSNGIAHTFNGSQTSIPFGGTDYSHMSLGGGAGSGSGSSSMSIDEQPLNANRGGGFDYKQMYVEDRQRQALPQTYQSEHFQHQGRDYSSSTNPRYPAQAYDAHRQAPEHFVKPGDALDASRPGPYGGGSKGYSSGSDRKLEEWQVPWNTRVYQHLEVGAIDRLNASRMYNPSTLPKEDILIINASKGGAVGAQPVITPSMKSGGDEGWFPGLGPSFFSHKTLRHLHGDGSDVDMQFPLILDRTIVSASADAPGGVKRARNS